MLQFWKINFTLDTGYEFLDRICIIVSNSEEEAEKKFREWILPKLKGETFLHKIKMELINISEANDFGILYQNAFEKL